MEMINGLISVRQISCSLIKTTADPITRFRQYPGQSAGDALDAWSA
jgi:hypothetical protein